jgi:uncharacterized membrane protein YesL
MIIPLPKFRNRDGKGVKKGEDTRPTLKNFFKQFVRKFSHLLSLNLLMLLQIAPIIVGLLAYLFIQRTPSQTSPLFAPLYGASLIEQSPASALLLALEAIPLNIPVFQPVAYWIIAGCALVMLLFNGLLTVGSFYVLRGLVRGDAVFVFSDFFYGIKRNLKQGFLFGLVDTLFTIVLVFDVVYYSGTVGAFWMDVLFWILTALAILYLIMRPYIYMMMITFDMKIRKMFKNALIFSALGIKRNLMAALGILLLLGLHALLMILLLPEVIITVIVPFVYIFAAVGFITAYAIYPVIDRYMIAPYRKTTHGVELDSCFDDDTVHN